MGSVYVPIKSPCKQRFPSPLSRAVSQKQSKAAILH